ncbi:hypothetical protein PLANTIT3_61228 [Plantibacter sp. T3]|nr:hypothetical protein PLANTIT3_61228 [Plantibacter sp. T3]
MTREHLARIPFRAGCPRSASRGDSSATVCFGAAWVELAYFDTVSVSSDRKPVTEPTLEKCDLCLDAERSPMSCVTTASLTLTSPEIEHMFESCPTGPLPRRSASVRPSGS